MASNLSSSRQARSGPIASANGSTRAADDLLSAQTKGHATLALAWLSDRIHVTTRATYVAVTGSLIAVMLLGIFFRYVLNSSLAWSDEVALVLFFWATWISIVVAYREGRHLSIDLLTRKARGTWIARLGVVREAMNGAFLAVLLISGVLAFEITSGGATDALKLPLSLSFAALPIAAGLMLVHWLSEALHTLTRWQVLATIVLGSLIVSLCLLQFGRPEELGSLRYLFLLFLFVLALVVGVPVAIALGLVGLFYISMSAVVPIITASLQVSDGVQSLTLVAIPLLVLSGSLMHVAGIAERLVALAQALVGRVRGGLGVANVVASFLFGDISGSAVSDTAAIGSIMIPSMKSRGYRADFCAALQGAAGTLGMMAPLAITLLLYASATQTSVRMLAAATFIPALLVAGSFIVIVIIHAHRHAYPREASSLREIPRAFARSLPGLFSLVLIAAGILGGVFTPAEVGAVLVAYILILTFFADGLAKPRRIYEQTIEAGCISGMSLFMVGTSALLGFMMARDFIPFAVRDAISELTTDPTALIAIAMAVVVILGMILEAPAIIFGFLPALLPLLISNGVDLIHFGILFSINMGLGMIVPPVALNLFVSTRLSGSTYSAAVKAALPFMAIMVLDLAIVTLFPRIALWLPRTLFQ